MCRYLWPCLPIQTTPLDWAWCPNPRYTSLPQETKWKSKKYLYKLYMYSIVTLMTHAIFCQWSEAFYLFKLPNPPLYWTVTKFNVSLLIEHLERRFELVTREFSNIDGSYPKVWMTLLQTHQRGPPISPCTIPIDNIITPPNHQYCYQHHH